MNRFLVIPLLLLTLCLSGCDWHRIRGNGIIKTEARAVTNFTQVNATGFYELEWHPGPPSFSLTTDENLMQEIVTTMEGNRLRIETKRGNLVPTDGIKVVITSPSLNGAELSGALEFHANGLNGTNFALQTSGAVKATLSGKVDRLLVSLTGASKLEAEELLTNDVELSVTGAGEANVTASNLLRAAITGAGKVQYGGKPKTVEKQVLGAGEIEPRD